MNEPETLIDAVRYYADRKTCFETMLSVKWPDGKIVCPKCHGELIGKIESRSMLQCKLKVCRKQFSVKVGTIFEDSPIGLDRWFVAVWCIANAKNGISSHELGRALGITQKTAWFMLHRVREAMKTPHCPRGCWLHGDSMSKTKALLAKLVQVPKKEVDRRVKRKKPKRKGK